MTARKILVLMLILSLAVSMATWVSAAVPRYINYQGKLTDSDDNPITDEVDITVRIYDVESGGEAIWTETQTITVTRGLFNILLGSTEELDDLDFNDAYWYSVEVESDGEMEPRQRLTAVAYAITADKLDGYDAEQFLRSDADTSLSGNLAISGTITGGANEDITLDPTGTGNIVMKIDSTSGDFRVSDGSTHWVVVDSATGNVTIAKDLTVSGTIYGTIASAGGNSTFTNIVVTNNADLRGTVYNSSGVLTIADALTQTGETNQVTFAGNVDAGNGLDVTGALTVSGATTLGGALDMNSNVDLDYTGDSAALSVTQAGNGPSASFAGQRVVVGASEITNANALSTGELYVQGDLEVDGTIYGDINSTGDTSLGDTTLESLVVTGVSDLRGNISDTGGVLTVADNLLVSGDTITSGDTDDYAFSVTQTLNDPGAAGGTDTYRAIKVNVTETDKTGWDNVYLMDLQAGGISQFSVDDTGHATVATPTADGHAVTKAYADAITPATAGGWTNVGASVYVVDNDYNVGVGTSSTDTYKLNVAGSTNTTSLYINGTQVTATADELNNVDGYTGTAANLNTLTNGSNADTLHVHAAGALSGVVVLSPSVTQTITAAAADAKPLVIKGTAGQTANLFEAQDTSALSHLTVEADGDIQIDTSGDAALGSITQSDTSASLAIATDTTKLGGGAGSDSDGVIKLGINEGNYQYIWYDANAGTDGLGAFLFSDQAVIPTASPAYLNFGVDRDAGTGRYNQYYAIKLDPDVANDLSYSKQKFSVVSIPNPGANWQASEKPLFDIASDGSFNIYDPSAGDAVFQIEPGGMLSHEFRNLIKNGSFEAFSGFERFVGYDPDYSEGYNNTTTGYSGGWNNFAPDGWIWVSGKAAQHSPALFTADNQGTFNLDFYDGSSALAVNEIEADYGENYALENPSDGNDAAIKQIIKGLEPDTWYSIGVAEMTTSAATTTAILDITGEYKPTTTLTGAIGESDTLNGSATSVVQAADTDDFPTGGTFRIGDELFDYNGKTASSFTGVTRAVNNTTAAAHAETVQIKGIFKPLKSVSTTFEYKKGSFKTDATGSDITLYLISQQTAGASDTEFARFDAIQMVEGKVLPKYGPTSIVDTGDQSIYGTLQLGRSADGRGGILSVDQYVRTRGIDFFTDDPGTSGAVGGSGAIGVPYSIINIYSTTAASLNPGTIHMDTSGNYIESVARKFQVRVQGTYDNPDVYVKYRYVDCVDPMADTWQDWNDTWYPSGSGVIISTTDTDLAFGIKIHFSDTSGHKGGDQWEFKVFGMSPEQDTYDSFNKQAAYTPSETRIFRDPVTKELTFEDSKAGKVKLSEIISQRTQPYISPPTRDPYNQGVTNITVTGELSTTYFTAGQNFEIWAAWEYDTGGNLITPPTKFGWNIMWMSGTTYTYYGNYNVSMNRGSEVALISTDAKDMGIKVTFPATGDIYNGERWRFFASPSMPANLAIHHHATDADGGALAAAGTTSPGFVIGTAVQPDSISLTFGNYATNKYLKWDNTLNRFDISNDLNVAGTLSAANISGPTSINGTTNLTFSVDNDNNAGSEPANGAGFVISGGTGNVGITYNDTADHLNISGPAGFTGMNIPTGATYKINGVNHGHGAVDLTGVVYTAPSAAQEIQPVQDVVPLTIKGKASGASNVLSIYDAGATPAERIAVDSAGHLKIAETTTGAATNSAATMYFGRNSTDDWETIGYDPALGTKGKFTFSAPLQVEASSPTGITFVEKDAGGSIIKSQGLTYDPGLDTFSFTGGTLKQTFQNLIRNPSFETSTPMGWAGLMNIFSYQISSVDTGGQAKFGKRSIILKDADASGNRGVKAMLSANDPDWGRLKGKTVTLSLWAKADSGVTTSIGFDSTGTETDMDTNNEITPEQTNEITVATTWQNFIARYDVPEAATKLNIILYGAQYSESGSDQYTQNIYVDGVTLVEGNLSLDYGPSPLFDTGNQVLYGSLAVGANYDPYNSSTYYEAPRILFGQPDAYFGGGYSGWSSGSGEIRFMKWGGNPAAQFTFNRGVWLRDDYTSDYGVTLKVGGFSDTVPTYANNRGDIFARGRIELDGKTVAGSDYNATPILMVGDGNVNYANTGAGNAYIAGKLEVDGGFYGDGANITNISGLNVTGITGITGTTSNNLIIGANTDEVSTDITLSFGNIDGGQKTLVYAGAGSDDFMLNDDLNLASNALKFTTNTLTDTKVGDYDAHLSDTSDPHGASMSISTGLTVPLINTQSGPLLLSPTTGLNVKLGDAAGTNKFTVQDSSSAEQFSINSDGVVNIAGGYNGSTGNGITLQPNGDLYFKGNLYQGGTTYTVDTVRFTGNYDVALNSRFGVGVTGVDTDYLQIDGDGHVSDADDAVTIADAFLQTGSANQAAFQGNVDAANGLDVSGQALTAASGFTLSAGALSLPNGSIATDFLAANAVTDDKVVDDLTITSTKTGTFAALSTSGNIIGSATLLDIDKSYMNNTQGTVSNTYTDHVFTRSVTANVGEGNTWTVDGAAVTINNVDSQVSGALADNSTLLKLKTGDRAGALANFIDGQDSTGATKFKIAADGTGTFGLDVNVSRDVYVSGDLHVDGDQVISGETLYDSAITVRTDSAAALLIEKSGVNGSGADIFTVDTNTPRVNVLTDLDVSGTVSAGTNDAFQVAANGAVIATGLNAGAGSIVTTGGLSAGTVGASGLVTASAGVNVSGADLAITDANDIVVNSDKFIVYGATGNAVMKGALTQLRSIGLIPEYDNSTPRGDGEDNFGTLSLLYQDNHNYYEWTTGESTPQDYDIVLRYRLPEGFASFDANPIKLWNRVSDNSGNTKIVISMLDTNGNPVTLNNATLTNADWTESTITISGVPAFSANGWITITIKMSADQGDTVDVGELTIKGNW